MSTDYKRGAAPSGVRLANTKPAFPLMSATIPQLVTRFKEIAEWDAAVQRWDSAIRQGGSDANAAPQMTFAVATEVLTPGSVPSVLVTTIGNLVTITFRLPRGTPATVIEIPHPGTGGGSGGSPDLSVLANYLLLTGGVITGILSVPTAAPGTNTTQASSTEFVTTAVAAANQYFNGDYGGVAPAFSPAASAATADDIGVLGAGNHWIWNGTVWGPPF